MPPPSRPAVEIEWCGARNGGCVRIPCPASSPATECSCEASSASSRVSAGRIVANRRASMVLPAPGGPTMKTLWPPAAATSRARRAGAWPRTSDRSTEPVAGSGGGASGGSGGSDVAAQAADDLPAIGAPTTRRPSTCAASSALANGTTTPASPAPGRGDRDRQHARRRHRARPGGTARRRTPSPATARPGTCAVAASTPMAIGRSRPGPSLRRLTGDRFTTTRRSGHSDPVDSTAGRTRSRASCTDAPGSPVMASERQPPADVRLDRDREPLHPDHGDAEDLASPSPRRSPSMARRTRYARHRPTSTESGREAGLVDGEPA